jgi:hypothetical protein
MLVAIARKDYEDRSAFSKPSITNPEDIARRQQPASGTWVLGQHDGLVLRPSTQKEKRSAGGADGPQGYPTDREGGEEPED